MTQQLSAFSETEKKAAERFKWWVVYLVREKRRLAGITEAVRAGAADAGHQAPLPTPEVESAEEFLLRAEQLGEEAFPDPLTIFESQEGDHGTVEAEELPSQPETSLASQVTQEAESEMPEVDTATQTVAPYELKKTSPAQGLEQAFKLPIVDDTNSLW